MKELSPHGKAQQSWFPSWFSSYPAENRFNTAFSLCQSSTYKVLKTERWTPSKACLNFLTPHPKCHYVHVSASLLVSPHKEDLFVKLQNTLQIPLKTCSSQLPSWLQQTDSQEGLLQGAVSILDPNKLLHPSPTSSPHPTQQNLLPPHLLTHPFLKGPPVSTHCAFFGLTGC